MALLKGQIKQTAEKIILLEKTIGMEKLTDQSASMSEQQLKLMEMVQSLQQLQIELNKAVESLQEKVYSTDEWKVKIDSRLKEVKELVDHVKP